MNRAPMQTRDFATQPREVMLSCTLTEWEARKRDSMALGIAIGMAIMAALCYLGLAMGWIG